MTWSDRNTILPPLHIPQSLNVKHCNYHTIIDHISNIIEIWLLWYSNQTKTVMLGFGLCMVYDCWIWRDTLFAAWRGSRPLTTLFVGMHIDLPTCNPSVLRCYVLTLGSLLKLFGRCWGCRIMQHCLALRFLSVVERSTDRHDRQSLLSAQSEDSRTMHKPDH